MRRETVKKGQSRDQDWDWKRPNITKKKRRTSRTRGRRRRRKDTTTTTRRREMTRIEGIKRHATIKLDKERELERERVSE